MKKKISIIMSCYNESEQELYDSINSILCQTYKNIELIIVNDNPTNQNLKKFLSHYSKDKRIKLINNEKNLGLAQSLNKAIKIAIGEYIARMDADDVSLPNRLEKQVAYLEAHDDCSMVATNRNDIDENSQIIQKNAAIIVSDKLLRRITRFGSIITHPSIMIRANILKEVGCYRSFPAAQDYDLWLRMLSARKRIHILPDVLLNYRIRQSSITKSNPSKQYLCKYYAQILYKERLNNGIDSFNENTLTNLLKCDPNMRNSLNNQHSQILLLKSKNVLGKISAITSIIKDFIIYPHNRRNLINQIAIRLLIILSKKK